MPVAVEVEELLQGEALMVPDMKEIGLLLAMALLPLHQCLPVQVILIQAAVAVAAKVRLLEVLVRAVRVWLLFDILIYTQMQ